jgi:hypothetical protein
MTRQLRTSIGLGLAITAVAGWLPITPAAFADTTTWDFDLTTHGEDVLWTTPTAVCTVADQYDTSYQITLVEVEVSYLGITFGPFDVTDQVPPEDLSGSETLAGPLPVTVHDDWVVYPEPPEPRGIEAHVYMGINADGYGEVAVTDVYLGTVEMDLGWPFGVVEVQIESIRMAGYVQVTPRLFGDLNHDDDVDLGDLAELLAHYGMVGGVTYEDGDIDGDDDVDLTDLTILLSHYGLTC